MISVFSWKFWYKHISFYQDKFSRNILGQNVHKACFVIAMTKEDKNSFDFRLQTLSIITPSRVLECHVLIIIWSKHFTYWLDIDEFMLVKVCILKSKLFSILIC